jgi:ABC-type sugar transport system permease subunit
MAMHASRARRPPSLGGERLREAGVGYAFVLVPLAVFALFQLYPIVYAFYVSAHEWGGIEGNLGYVGLDNYRELWHDEAFWTWPPERGTAFWNTVYYALLVVHPFRGRTVFRSAYYFPALVSSAAISAIAIYLLSADGLVNAAIGAVLGREFDQPWFGDPDTALESIVVLDAWTTSGTMMLFYLAALQSIPTDVYEAAAIDKAGAWRTFRKITFPLLKPAHFFVAVVSVIGALKLFDQAFIISTGSGGPAGSTMTAVMYVYSVTIGEFNFGYGATVGVVLFLIIFTFTVVQRLLFGRAEVGY